MVASSQTNLPTTNTASCIPSSHCIVDEGMAQCNPRPMDDDDRVESIISTWRPTEKTVAADGGPFKLCSQTQRCHVAAFEHGSSYNDLFFIYISLFFFPWFYLDFSSLILMLVMLASHGSRFWCCCCCCCSHFLQSSLESRSTLFHSVSGCFQLVLRSFVCGTTRYVQEHRENEFRKQLCGSKLPLTGTGSFEFCSFFTSESLWENILELLYSEEDIHLIMKAIHMPWT